MSTADILTCHEQLDSCVNSSTTGDNGDFEKFVSCFDKQIVPSYFITRREGNMCVSSSLAMAGEDVEGILNIIYVKNDVWHHFHSLLTVPNLEMFKQFISLSKGLDQLFVNIRGLCHVTSDDTFIIILQSSTSEIYMVEFMVNDNGTVSCLCCQDELDHLTPF